MKKRLAQALLALSLVGGGAWWTHTTYITPEEVQSPDDPNSGYLFDDTTAVMIQVAREWVEEHHPGVKFIYNSGVRTEEHNQSVGGVPTSSHSVTCYCAVDIAARSDYERAVIIEALWLVGFRRIGIGRTFIHVDRDPNKNSPRVWHYY